MSWSLSCLWRKIDISILSTTRSRYLWKFPVYIESIKAGLAYLSVLLFSWLHQMIIGISKFHERETLIPNITFLGIWTCWVTDNLLTLSHVKVYRTRVSVRRELKHKSQWEEGGMRCDVVSSVICETQWGRGVVGKLDTCTLGWNVEPYSVEQMHPMLVYHNPYPSSFYSSLPNSLFSCVTLLHPK